MAPISTTWSSTTSTSSRSICPLLCACVYLPLNCGPNRNICFVISRTRAPSNSLLLQYSCSDIYTYMVSEGGWAGQQRAGSGWWHNISTKQQPSYERTYDQSEIRNIELDVCLYLGEFAGRRLNINVCITIYNMQAAELTAAAPISLFFATALPYLHFYYGRRY